MPGLQSIVSAWTKINHDHVEYVADKNGVLHPIQQGPGASQSQHAVYNVSGGGVQPSQFQVQQHHKVVHQLGPLEASSQATPPASSATVNNRLQGGGINIAVGVANGGAIIADGGVIIDPRSQTYQPSPQLSTGSSLSSYSFAKNGQLIHHSSGGGGGGGGSSTEATISTPLTAGTNFTQSQQQSLLQQQSACPLNLTNTAAISTSSANQLSQQSSINTAAAISTPAAHNLHAAHQQRYQLHGQQQQQMTQQQLQSMLITSQSSTKTALQQEQQQLARRQSSSSSTRRSNSNISGPSNFQHGVASALSNQLESYTKAGNVDIPPPPSQAGANAILGRRKSNASVSILTKNNNANAQQQSLVQKQLLGQSPPISLNPNKKDSGSVGSGSGLAGALAHSPSSSLWHSQRSVSSRDRDGESSRGSGAESVTASLDMLNRNDMPHLPVGGGGSGVSGNSTTIEELNASAKHALQSMNNLTLKQQQTQQIMMMGKTPPQNNVTTTPIGPAPSSTISSSVPIPRTPSGGRLSNALFHRQTKLRKQKSRTDLAREMALDNRNQTSYTSRSSNIKTTTSDRDVSVQSSSSKSELDVSRTSSLSSMLLHNSSSSSIPVLQQQKQQQQSGITFGSSSVQQQQHQKKPMQLTQQHFQTGRRSRMPDFLQQTSIQEETDGGLLGQLQQQQQQQQSQLNNVGMNHSSLLSESLQHGYNQNELGGDILDRRVRQNPLTASQMSPLIPGRGGFPLQPLLAEQRRRGSSSDTAVTGNQSLEIQQQHQQQGVQQQQQGVGNMMDSNAPPTLPENAVVNDSNNALTSPIQQLTNQPQQHQQHGVCSGCDRCAQMESTLLALQADLEYIRGLELQREQDGGESNLNNRASPLPTINQKTPPYYTRTDSFTGNQSVSSAVSKSSRGSRTNSMLLRRHNSTSVNGGGGSSVVTGMSRTRTQPTNFASKTSMFLRDASKRLSDLSTRHKRQVKQTTHERAYWQNDMHLKLEKFALMCKNLNEEAAFRANEVKETKALLDKMTSERNALASQIDTLKARVEVYQGENVDMAKLRQEWNEEREQMLNTMEKSAKDRDIKVDDLTKRLELAAETIENERKHQNMRRQVIFPSRQDSSSASKLDTSYHSISTPPSPNPKVDSAAVQTTNDIATKAQMSLMAALEQSSIREREMQARIKQLEIQAGRNNIDCEGGAAMSIRRISSTASLGGI